MSILCSISAIKGPPRAIKNYISPQVNILAIHFAFLWFFKLFLMYPLSLQELRSDNAAYLDLFTLLLSLIFYGP